MSGHTPGPWRIEDGEVRIVAPDDRHSTGYAHIADASSWWVGNDQAKANARLIAAAPDLLAVLRMVLDCGALDDREHFGVLENIDLAIAKATEAQASA